MGSGNTGTDDNPRHATDYVQRNALHIATVLADFIEQEVLPGLEIPADGFWQEFAALIQAFSCRNRELLARRDQLQTTIDQWQLDNPGATVAQQKQFLSAVGYLVPEPADFSINISNVDAAIAKIPGPQLVVPVKNARYALNASNARWGSLYDALYGTNVIAEPEKSPGYNPARGEKVVAYAADFLDRHLPLYGASHRDIEGYSIVANELLANAPGGEPVGLKNPAQFAGYRGDTNSPDTILLVNNQLHIELQIDRSHPVGQSSPAGVKDVLLESAVTTIQDCEDSVAAVDAEDKTEVYRNWLGLMNGSLQTSFSKGDKTVQRTLDTDREYLSPTGAAFSLPGRSLLLVRNVGHLMTNNAILDAGGEEVFEGIMDGVVTSLIALYDLRGKSTVRNSQTGSVYIVKPKMHGPEETRFTCELFAAIEKMLDIPENTLKLGIMDEERRTSLNLKACIYEARQRVIFINTGFLDRTGDEIHTAMKAGPVVRKHDMRGSQWIKAYEKSNVVVGLRCGFSGVAQIGKGMWAMPDEMKKMVDSKSAHPLSGANCAWVPSPTAATLHAMHYHETDVLQLQQHLLEQVHSGEQQALREELLVLPLLHKAETLSTNAIQRELDNNCQGILGYVVRWINDGVGCSKVPDIDNLGLMEDRATLRISSQHIANWLEHDICSKQQVMETLLKMAKIVDEQNREDSSYRPLSGDPDNNIAFQAASRLIFEGSSQPNGYTEPLLHEMRKLAKRYFAGQE